MTLFLCGDVMTGRGIDQILPHPSRPELYEQFVKVARDYVEIAEQANGAIPKAVSISYVWGDALDELKRVNPAARIINLETSVTTSENWEDKGINYRMHPQNIGVLRAAGIDACALANNHVLDWGGAGLIETLDVLAGAGVKTAGAGRDIQEAESPAVVEFQDGGRCGRILFFSMGSESSGIPSNWAATLENPGVAFLKDFSSRTVQWVRERVLAMKRASDIAIVSIHWGENWGYDIPDEQRRFAHALIDEAGVDLIHGHSSHHVKGVEVYQDKLILYGCGDFLNDYEGIRGHEEFRDDLTLMYFPRVEMGTGRVLSLRMVPMRIKRFRLNRASHEDARWLCATLNREGRQLSTKVLLEADESLTLTWGNQKQVAG